MLGSIPTSTPPATWNVLVSVEVRMKMSRSFTDVRNPSSWWYTDQKSYVEVSDSSRHGYISPQTGLSAFESKEHPEGKNSLQESPSRSLEHLTLSGER